MTTLVGVDGRCVRASRGRKRSIAVGALSSLTFALPLSAAESHGPATRGEAQFSMGVGYGWSRYEHSNPLRWGVFLQTGYTATNGAYFGVIGDAYSGSSIEHEDGHTDRAMVGLGAEIGYDLRLAERWTMRFALLNAAGGLETIRCLQLQPPPSMESCSDAEYSWRYAIGPSVRALYLWEKALFFAELRQTSYFSSSTAIFGGTAIVGFGFHF